MPFEVTTEGKAQSEKLIIKEDANIDLNLKAKLGKKFQWGIDTIPRNVPKNSVIFPIAANLDSYNTHHFRRETLEDKVTLNDIYQVLGSLSEVETHSIQKNYKAITKQFRIRNAYSAAAHLALGFVFIC